MSLDVLVFIGMAEKEFFPNNAVDYVTLKFFAPAIVHGCNSLKNSKSALVWPIAGCLWIIWIFLAPTSEILGVEHTHSALNRD